MKGVILVSKINFTNSVHLLTFLKKTYRQKNEMSAHSRLETPGDLALRRYPEVTSQNENATKW